MAQRVRIMRRFFLLVVSIALFVGGIWGTWHLIVQNEFGWPFFGAANCLWIGFYLLLHDFFLPLLSRQQFIPSKGHSSESRLFTEEEIRLHRARGKLIEERRI